MILRPTCPFELDRVMQVLDDGRTSIGLLGIDQWQAGYPFRESIEADVQTGKSYVVEHDGSIIATAMIDFDGEPTYDEIEGAWASPGTSVNPDYGCVHRVAVALEGRGKGAAKFILSEAANMARGMGKKGLRIDTHPGNTPMRSLMDSCGFQYRGVIYISHAGEGTPERVAYEKLL